MNIPKPKKNHINQKVVRRLRWRIIAWSHGKEESIRRLRGTGERREENITHPSQKAPRILRQNHLNLILILTQVYHRHRHHLTLVLLVTIGERRERDLLEETSINVGKGEINEETESEGGVTREQSTNQKDHMSVVKVKVVRTMVLLILMGKPNLRLLHPERQQLLFLIKMEWMLKGKRVNIQGKMESS